jgi:hypothetical protein
MSGPAQDVPPESYVAAVTAEEPAPAAIAVAAPAASTALLPAALELEALFGPAMVRSIQN